MLQKTWKLINVALLKKIRRVLLLNFSYFGLFFSRFVPAVPNETFVFISTQPSKMQESIGWWLQILGANFFLETLGNGKESPHAAFQADDERAFTMPSQCLRFLYDIPSFHLFNFQQVVNTGFHDVNVLPFMSNFKYFFNLFTVNVQVWQWFCDYLYTVLFLSKL